jgi:hypothetical protein
MIIARKPGSLHGCGNDSSFEFANNNEALTPQGFSLGASSENVTWQ